MHFYAIIFTRYPSALKTYERLNNMLENSTSITDRQETKAHKGSVKQDYTRANATFGS